MTLAFLGGHDKLFHAMTVGNSLFVAFVVWSLFMMMKEGVKAKDPQAVAVYGKWPEWLRKMLKWDAP
jgi:hypothetical protein